jgi:predicted patatin/cPLA2 family phospholipase
LKWALCKYPALLDALQKRQIVYNETLEYVEKQAEAGKIFLFRPDLPLPVKRICHDPDILQQTYEIGRAKAGQELLRLKQFLARKGK